LPILRIICGFVMIAALGSCSRSPTDEPGAIPPPLQISASMPSAGEASSEEVDLPVVWADESWKPDQPSRDWKYLVIHHTATATGSVESIHRSHLARKDADGNPWRGIGYHFVIGNGEGMPDGAVEPTFRWFDQLEGAHAGDVTYNHEGVGICLVGNFEQHPPTPAQLTALTTLTQSLTAAFEIPVANIKRHGELKSTACPGRLFPMQQLRDEALADRQPRRSARRHPASTHSLGVMRSLSAGTRNP
jgi:N-acetyl-anhydromuramyl-L-alanine amidase AmpD